MAVGGPRHRKCRIPIFPSNSSAWWSRPRSHARIRWASATATSRTRRPSKRCGAVWTTCRSTARLSLARGSATRRRCSTSARRSVSRRSGVVRASFPEVDIAVDPLEGTNLCATGAPNALAVLATSDRGGLLHAPDLYMEKLVVGPSAKDAVSLDAPVDRQPAGDCAVPGAQGRGSRRDRPRSSATRKDHRADPRRRRTHPTHHRRRSLGGHRRGRRRKRRARGHGHGWCAGRGSHRRGDALPERRDLRPTRRQDSRAPGAVPGDGHQGRAQDLHVAGARLRLIDHICRDRCHRRRPDEGGALLRRRHSHRIGRHAEQSTARQVHRHDSRRAIASRQSDDSDT